MNSSPFLATGALGVGEGSGFASPSKPGGLPPSSLEIKSGFLSSLITAVPNEADVSATGITPGSVLMEGVAVWFGVVVVG